MKKPIDLILFDLGNTLIYDRDPWPPILSRADAELWRVLNDAGVGLSRREVYGEFETLFSLYNVRHRNDLSEPTTAAILDELLSQKGYQLPKETLRAALHAMYAVTQSNWFAEGDALGILKLLKGRGFRLGVVSNAADDENTLRLIDKSGFRPYIEYVVSSAAFGKRKPHPGIFQVALDHFGVPAERAVMIGDTYEADIAGGQAVGMNTIWITRGVDGFHRDLDVRADAVITSLNEIPDILTR